jgi:hypothetical protein
MGVEDKIKLNKKREAVTKVFLNLGNHLNLNLH